SYRCKGAPVYEPYSPDPRHKFSIKRVDAILDDEVICVDAKGVSQFNQLLSRKRGAIFYAFDLLSLDGADIRRRHLLDRKERLAESVLRRTLRRFLNTKHEEVAGKDHCGILLTVSRKH